MKKRTKWLSFLLAFAIVLSTCTIAFSVFAATPADVSKAIENMKEPAALTATIESDYAALSDGEKESIEVPLLYKLYRYCYQKNGNNNAAIAKVITALGDFTDNTVAGINLGLSMQGIGYVPYTDPTTGKEVTNKRFSFSPANLKFGDPAFDAMYQAYKDMWNNATPYVRSIADMQKYTLAQTRTPFFGNVMQMEAYSTNRRAFVYNAELEYLGATPADVQEKFENEFIWSPLTENYFTAAKDVANIYNAYVKGEMSSAEFLSKTEGLSEAALPDADYISLTNKPFVLYAAGSLEPTLASASEIFKAINEVRTTLQPIVDFVAMVNSITIPEAPSKEFNNKVAALRVAAAKLGDSLATIQSDYPDVYAKYEKVLTMYYNDIIEKDGMAETHTPVKEETVDYEMARPYGDIITKTLIPSIDSIVNTLIPSIAGGKSLNEFADDLLFTNANVKPLVLMLGNLMGESKDFTPKAAATIMQNYVETVEAGARLAALVNDESGWDAVPANFNWGVTPGDFEGFVLTVLGAVSASSLGGILGIAEGLLLPNAVDFGDDGYIKTFSPGLYETVVIPLLEAFGAENVMDSATYSQNCPELGVTTNSLATDHQAILMILNQIYDVYARLLADPVGYLTQNLPNIVYHLEDGCIFDAVGTLLVQLSSGDTPLIPAETAEMIKGYLSLDGIFEALGPTLESAGIKLSADDIKKFAHLGKSTVVPTASMQYETTIYVVGNQDAVVRQLSKILEPIALQLLDSKLGFSFDPAKEFVKVQAPNYPHDGKMGKDVMIAMINGLDGLIGGFVDLNDTINNLLCTPEMAANAITGIYGLIGSLDLSSVGMKLPFTPKDVAKMLTEEKYEDLAAALQMDSWNDVALVLKNGDTVVYQCDMGFKAGDRNGFVDCLVASLRPLVKMLADAGLVVNVVGDDGKAESYGLYETVIIPVFEALGVKPAADSVTYTSNYNKLLLKADKGLAYDYLLKTILSPVLDLLNQVATSPASTLMGLLPNLAYAVQYNEDLAFIGNLLAGEDGNIDLAGMVNGLIGGLLPGFELPAISLDALASCGTVKTMNSMSQLHDTYTNVVPDKADAFVTVFYYLYDAINYKDNLKTISGLLAGIDGLDPTLATMIDTILNDVFTRGKEEALCMLGTILAADVWECPDTADDANSGKSTPNAGDMGIAAVAVLPILFAAGAAIILLRKKKSQAAI